MSAWVISSGPCQHLRSVGVSVDSIDPCPCVWCQWPADPLPPCECDLDGCPECDPEDEDAA